MRLLGSRKALMPPSNSSRMRLRIHQRVVGARVAQLEQTLLGAGQNLVGLLLADDAAVDQLAAT